MAVSLMKPPGLDVMALAPGLDPLTSLDPVLAEAPAAALLLLLNDEPLPPAALLLHGNTELRITIKPYTITLKTHSLCIQHFRAVVCPFKDRVRLDQRPTQ